MPGWQEDMSGWLEVHKCVICSSACTTGAHTRLNGACLTDDDHSATVAMEVNHTLCQAGRKACQAGASGHPRQTEQQACTHSSCTTGRCPVCAALWSAVARPQCVKASTAAPACKETAKNATHTHTECMLHGMRAGMHSSTGQLRYCRCGTWQSCVAAASGSSSSSNCC